MVTEEPQDYGGHQNGLCSHMALPFLELLKIGTHLFRTSLIKFCQGIEYIPHVLGSLNSPFKEQALDILWSLKKERKKEKSFGLNLYLIY